MKFTKQSPSHQRNSQPHHGGLSCGRMGQVSNADSPRLQVAMETQKDTVGVAVKVEQRSDQSCQMTELIDLQEET